ncbi:Sip1-related alpha-galactosidase [Paenibacillus sp. CC-CFT747]|nr:Sip1-related alpha-galactosidase [Paenibacillus sp. CC-CFT747]
MFTYISDNQSIAVEGLGQVMSGFHVSVRLDSHAVEKLSYKTFLTTEDTGKLGPYTDHTCFYGNEDDTINVRLVFRCQENSVLVYVHGEIRNPSDFGSQKSFAPSGGILVGIDSLEDVQSLLANYQHKDWWTRPHFDPELTRLPERTQSLLWKTSHTYCHLLPVCGPVFRTDLGGTEEGLSIRVSSHQGGLVRTDAFAFILGTGRNPYQLIQEQVHRALKELDYSTLPRTDKTYPEILDYLGWCSWDAFYQQVNEEGLLAKAAELKEKELPVRWFMIDDGWSKTTDNKLAAFEAELAKFPKGLANAVRELKKNYGVSWVGVWHTIMGYWGGIHPDSPLAREYADYLWTTSKGHRIPFPDAGRGFGFWNAWHNFLRLQGIDFVKVDSQSAVGNYLKYYHSAGRGAAAAHQALEASVALHFNKTVINCMGMSAENIWHRPQSAVSRSSDDFVPREAEGFQEHALQNGYNSYFHGPFYWGDWDMFWTINHDDVQNAVLRAVSGGPVYFSDAVGRTDPAKVWPLIYKNGRIIRCEETPNPTEDCLTLDPARTAVPLKLWNTCQGAGVVAAFHVLLSEGAVTGTIGGKDIPHLAERECLVYEHFSGSTFLLQPGESREFTLEKGQCALYLLLPLTGPVTPIGLTEKYVSVDAVREVRTGERSTFVFLKEAGPFTFQAESKPQEVLVFGTPVEIQEKGDGLYTVHTGAWDGEVAVEIIHS